MPPRSRRRSGRGRARAGIVLPGGVSPLAEARLGARPLAPPRVAGIPAAALATSVLAVASLLGAGCLAPREAPPRRAPAGRAIYLLDMDADPFGLGGRPGAVFRLDLARGALDPVASSLDWRAPFAAIPAPTPGALWVLDFGHEQAVKEGDARPAVFFAVDLRPAAVPVRGRGVHGLGVRSLGAARGLVNPIQLAASPWGILVADEDADPLGLGVDTGAVFRLEDPAAEQAHPLAAGADLVAPTDVAIDARGRLLLLDADADPTAAGKGGGALFEVDPRAGAITLLAAPDFWVSPLALVPEPSGSVLVVDSNADPRHHGHVGGAVFRVRLDDPAARDPRTGLAAVELVAAPEEFVDPVDAIPLAPGWILVADASADPLGLGTDGTGIGFGGKGRGAVWFVSLATGRATLAAASPALVNPAGLVAVPVPPAPGAGDAARGAGGDAARRAGGDAARGAGDADRGKGRRGEERR